MRINSRPLLLVTMPSRSCVIELHLPILDLILQMHVVQMPVQRAANFRQRKIVRADQADRAALQQRMNNSLGTDAPVF